MRGTEPTDPLPNFLEARDPRFGAGERPIELLPQIWADRLVPLVKVGGTQFLDLFQGQPERAQAPDHLQAPEGGFVEQPVVAVTSAEPVDQSEALVFAERPDRHAGSPSELSDRHRLVHWRIHLPRLLPSRCQRRRRNTAKIYGMPGMLDKPEIAVKASARFFKGLGDATRLRILELLLERERSVGELVELLDLPQARVSTHLACLRWCGYVQARKEGRWVWYHVSDRRIEKLLELADELAVPNAQHLASCTRIGPEWV